MTGVDPLAGAALFLQHSAKAKSTEAADLALAVQIAAVTAGHPLAIALLAGEWDVSGEVERAAFLAQWPDELDAATRPGMASHHATFATAFNRSWQALDSQARQQLAALGRFSAPFFVAGASFLWQGDAPADEGAEQAVRATLEEFRRRSLLRVEGTYTDSDRVATYRLDPVIQRELLVRLKDPSSLDNAFAAYCAWLVDRAHGQIGSDVALNRLIFVWLDELTALAEAQPAAFSARYFWQLAVLLRHYGRIAAAYDLLDKGEQAATLAADDKLRVASFTHVLSCKSSAVIYRRRSRPSKSACG